VPSSTGYRGLLLRDCEEVENEFDSQFAYSKELFEDVFDSWSLKTKYPMLFLNQRAPGHGEPAMSRHLTW